MPASTTKTSEWIYTKPGIKVELDSGSVLFEIFALQKCVCGVERVNPYVYLGCFSPRMVRELDINSLASPLSNYPFIPLSPMIRCREETRYSCAAHMLLLWNTDKVPFADKAG